MAPVWTGDWRGARWRSWRHGENGWPTQSLRGCFGPGDRGTRVRFRVRVSRFAFAYASRVCASRHTTPQTVLWDCGLCLRVRLLCPHVVPASDAMRPMSDVRVRLSLSVCRSATANSCGSWRVCACSRAVLSVDRCECVYECVVCVMRKAMAICT